MNLSHEDQQKFISWQVKFMMGGNGSYMCSWGISTDALSK